MTKRLPQLQIYNDFTILRNSSTISMLRKWRNISHGLVCTPLQVPMTPSRNWKDRPSCIYFLLFLISCCCCLLGNVFLRYLKVAWKDAQKAQPTNRLNKSNKYRTCESRRVYADLFPPIRKLPFLWSLLNIIQLKEFNIANQQVMFIFSIQK